MAHCTEEVSSFFTANNKQHSIQDRSRENMYIGALQQGEQLIEESNKSSQENTNKSKENDKDNIENMKSTVTQVTAESKQYIEWLIKIHLQYNENNNELQHLFQQFENGKKRSFDLQMENEKLSSEKEKVISLSCEILTKVKNTWQVCDDLSNYQKNLEYFKEKEIDNSKDGVFFENVKLSATVKQLYESFIGMIDIYRKESDILRKIVEEEDHQRITMLKDIKSVFEKENVAYKEELRLCKHEEDTNFALTSEYNNLTRSMEEEAVKLKEEIKTANESLCSYASTNKVLEVEINSYKTKELELEDAFQTTVQMRDSLKNECSALEEQLMGIDYKGAAVQEELVKAKETLSCLELEYNEKTIQQENSEKRKIDLLEQKVSSENELLTMKERLEDIKNSDNLSFQELEDLKSTLETIQNRYEASSNKYSMELSQLENEFAEIMAELNLKSIETEEKNIKKNDLLNKLDESNKELKVLESEYELAKTSAIEGCTKLKELQMSIGEETLKSEDLKETLLVTKNNIVNKNAELEKMLEDSANYEDETIKTINQIIDNINNVKEKQKITLSECNEKRQAIMNDLDECRNNSMKKSNEIDAEINRLREENTILKEKLSKLFSERESIQRETKLEIKLLQDRKKALKGEIKNVEPVSKDWRNSSFEAIKLKHIPPTPILTPPTQIASSQPITKTKYDESDSSQSCIDFKVFMNRRLPVEDIIPAKRRFSMLSSSQPAILPIPNHEPKHLYHKAASLPRKQMTQRKSKGNRHEPLDLLSTL